MIKPHSTDTRPQAPQAPTTIRMPKHRDADFGGWGPRLGF